MDTDLYRSASLRNIEAIHAGEPLMARAGMAAADWARGTTVPDVATLQ